MQAKGEIFHGELCWKYDIRVYDCSIYLSHQVGSISACTSGSEPAAFTPVLPHVHGCCFVCKNCVTSMVITNQFWYFYTPVFTQAWRIIYASIVFHFYFSMAISIHVVELKWWSLRNLVRAAMLEHFYKLSGRDFA